MALFCPLCHSILYYESKEYEGAGFTCLRCMYRLPINRNYYTTSMYRDHKEIVPSDPIGNEMEHAPKIPAVCPDCNNGEAYFMSIQTRSADEPTTQFFVCTACNKRWKE